MPGTRDRLTVMSATSAAIAAGVVQELGPCVDACEAQLAAVGDSQAALLAQIQVIQDGACAPVCLWRACIHTRSVGAALDAFRAANPPAKFDEQIAKLERCRRRLAQLSLRAEDVQIRVSLLAGKWLPRPPPGAAAREALAREMSIPTERLSGIVRGFVAEMEAGLSGGESTCVAPRRGCVRMAPTRARWGRTQPQDDPELRDAATYGD